MDKTDILPEAPHLAARELNASANGTKPPFSEHPGPRRILRTVLVRLVSGKVLAVKIILLLAVLILHFQSRQQTAQSLSRQPNEFYLDSNTYPQCYAVSLALVAGKGFRDLTWPKAADRAEIKPIKEFLSMQRQKVTPEEWVAFLDSRHVVSLPPHSFERSRLLDISVTALIWKMFGISWPVFYVFSSLASTATCLLIFLIARQLTGSYWAGICAAMLFLASPFENHFAIRSLRDISPLWFGTLAFAFFICVADRFRSGKWNYVSFFALGVLAMLGRGWRVDVLLLIPFLLAALVVYLVLRRRGWMQVLLGSGLFLGGAWTADRLIHTLCSSEPGSGWVFHIAHYGDASRCNLMGLENSFQIPREDIQTIFNACCFNEGKRPDHPLAINKGNEYQGLCLDFYDKEYGQVCKEMFTGALKYHLYQYLSFWPQFFFRALGAFPGPESLQGERVHLLQISRMSWAGPIYEWCLDPLTRCLPYLFLLGIPTLLLIGADKIRGAIFVAFSLYYSVAWFAVLPEQKHLGQLLLPLTVTGGMGLWGLARACRFLFLSRNGADFPFFFPRSFQIGCGLAVALAAGWGLACVLAYPYSLRHRENLLNDIRALAVHGQDAPATIKDRRVFSKYLDPAASPAGANAEKIGYLLTIQAGWNSGYLTCRHVHFPSPTLPERIFITRHKLSPGKLQYFAVSCFQAAKYRDDRPYACTVTLNTGAWIVSSKRLDLSSWKKLPFSTVFCDEEPATPGSPLVGHFSSNDPLANQFGLKLSFNDLSTEVAYWCPGLSILGLPSEQNFEYPGLNPVRLIANFDHDSGLLSNDGNGKGSTKTRRLENSELSQFVLSCFRVSMAKTIGALHPPGSLEEANQSGLPLSHWFPQSGVTFSASSQGASWHVAAEQSGTLALYSPLSVPEDGVYLFKLKYRPGAGDLSLQAVPVNRETSLRQSRRATQEGDDVVLCLEAKLKAGEPFQLRLDSHPVAGSAACRFTLKEFQAYREKHPTWELSRKTD